MVCSLREDMQRFWAKNTAGSGFQSKTSIEQFQKLMKRFVLVLISVNILFYSTYSLMAGARCWLSIWPYWNKFVYFFFQEMALSTKNTANVTFEKLFWKFLRLELSLFSVYRRVIRQPIYAMYFEKSLLIKIIKLIKIHKVITINIKFSI